MKEYFKFKNKLRIEYNVIEEDNELTASKFS